MPHGDPTRIQELTAKRGFDALVAHTPDNVYYLSGYMAFVQRANGALSAMVPADPNLKPAMSCATLEQQWVRERSHIEDVRPIRQWVETDDAAALADGLTVSLEKPLQHDLDHAFQTLGDVLTDRGLRSGRIGCELQAMPPGLLARLRQMLPDLRIEDATQLFWELRSIKTAEEVAALRSATALVEQALKSTMLDSNPRGKTVSQLRLEFQIAVAEAVRGQPDGGGFQGIRIYISVGGLVGPTHGRTDKPVRDGDIVWVDCGVGVDGYASDIGRVFSVGEPSRLSRRVYEGLSAGFETTLPLIKPGAKLSDIFQIAQETIRANGFPTYTRGHVGHSIGIGFDEQPPFITWSEHRRIEPGMAFALETPYYIRGLGGFQIEDNLVTTGDGAELLTRLPRTLFIV